MISYRPGRRQLLSAALAAALPGGWTAVAAAQDGVVNWPAKPVKLVVGYAPGGATDTIARTLAAKFSELTGQQFVVDNRSGANSNIGAQAVAAAAPDGTTLYVGSIANTINMSLYQAPGYDIEKDFEPVGLIAKLPNVLVVNPKLPVYSVQQYIRFAAETPGGVTFASSGAGSSIHLSGEMFKMVTKSNMLHVPYRGSAPAVNDLLAGQVQSMFDNLPSSLPHIRAGTLRALAVTSAQRSPVLPDVPTMIEAGLAEFEVQSWFGLFAPAATAPAIVDKANALLDRALQADDVKARLEGLGATPEPGTRADLRAFVASETKRWGDVVKASGAKAN